MASSHSNQLAIPFRKSTHLSFSTAIRQYISKKYDQHPDMFRDDLAVIDTLRRDAVNVREAHRSGIKKLQAYAGQLVWIGGKFPIDIGADFTWYPSLGYNTERPLGANNIKYELLNILYNLAALYCQLAVGTNHSDIDGLKTAAAYYSQAAGVLSHMKTAILPDLRMTNPPDDMDEATLESLQQLMLAQSQECFWQKSVTEKYKDTTIAKLAARLSDLYNTAGEAAMKSEAISGAWIHHMSAKHHHFAGAAQYRASLDCLEKRKYGEEIARLKDALACSNEGLRETRGGYLSAHIQTDLNGLKQRIEEDLKRAERDNDVIYLNPVPPKSELKILDRANMAVTRIPPEVESPYEFLGDHAAFGPALFNKLVPFAVHMAVSIYEERRDRRVNKDIIEELEVLTERLHEILSSLKLPGSLQALEKPLGLPGTLSQHAEEIRQADAIGRLERSFADIEKLKASDRATFDEGKALLAAEVEEDNRLRGTYGTQRWTRPDGKNDPQGSKLLNQAAEIDGYFGPSASSDAVVREKFNAVESMLFILAGSDRALLDFVPSSRKTEIPEAVKPALGRLRGAYNDVLRVESRRRKRVEALREKARSDDLKSDILKEAARLERTYPNTPIATAHFEDFFEKRLDTFYDPDVQMVEKEAEEQEKILADVTRANRDFEAQKRTTGDRGTREREAALQKLDNAYYKYKEIVNNVEAGRKFYNDLSRMVGSFRDQCRNWVQERRKDARSLEEEISMPPLSSLNMNQQSPPAQAFHPAAQPSHQFYAQQQQHHHHHQPPLHSQAEAGIQSWAGNIPPQQPKPTQPLQQMWAPDMGIKFAPSPAPGPPGQDPAGGGTKASGTWDPGSGIRFG